MENNNIKNTLRPEDIILETILSSSNIDLENISDKELKIIIKKEIERANYLTEWQTGCTMENVMDKYAVERIIKKVENTEQRTSKKIKGVGYLFMVWGSLKIISALYVIFISPLLSYSDAFFGIVIGILYIILGKRISEEINDYTRYYLVTLFWFVTVTGIINFFVKVSSGETSPVGLVISIFFAFSAFNSLRKLKKIQIKPTTIKYKISGYRWIWFAIVSIIMVFVGVFFDVNKNIENITEIPINKDQQYSEIIENMYRNTKYGFRIKFPEGWKIGVGDGIHIVQKASFENSTISIMILKFDLGDEIGISSIKDTGSSKEFSDTFIEGIKEKFTDVLIINYGETKIDNWPAYWVEYSASSQVLDFKLKMTNLVYFLARGDTMYSIGVGTATDDYSKIKPLFLQSVSTFVLENH